MAEYEIITIGDGGVLHTTTGTIAEAEGELSKYRTGGLTGTLTNLSFESLRRESVAALLEGTPWAAGYPMLEAQIGTHGADTGAVATYWSGIWGTYEALAAFIEETREINLAAVVAAGSVMAVDAVKVALVWPNFPEPGASAASLVAVAPTLSGPTALIALTPTAAVGIPSVFVPQAPDPGLLAVVAPGPVVQIA